MIMNEQKDNYLPIELIIISSFGPYISRSGIRIDHIIIYFIFLMSIIRLLVTKKNCLKYKPNFFMFLNMIFFVIWAIIITFFKRENVSTYSIIASLESIIQPIAILIITMTYITNYNQSFDLLIHKIYRVLSYMLLINTFIILISMNFNITPLLARFHNSNMDATLAIKSLSMGRYKGIFNQAIESGLMYSLGILLWAYDRTVKERKSYFDYLVLIGLIIGGISSVSKVFILGGIPLFVFYLILSKQINVRATIKCIPIAIIIIFILNKFFLLWSGFDYFVRLFDANYIIKNGVIDTFTAGRFGSSDTFIKNNINNVLNKSLIAGNGLGSIVGPTDNMFVFILYEGGLVALFFYFCIILNIVRVTLIGFKNKIIRESSFLLVLLILIIGSNIGAPTLYLNRVSAVLWIILTVIIYRICSRQ